MVDIVRSTVIQNVQAHYVKIKITPLLQSSLKGVRGKAFFQESFPRKKKEKPNEKNNDIFFKRPRKI